MPPRLPESSSKDFSINVALAEQISKSIDQSEILKIQEYLRQIYTPPVAETLNEFTLSQEIKIQLTKDMVKACMSAGPGTELNNLVFIFNNDYFKDSLGGLTGFEKYLSIRNDILEKAFNNINNTVEAQLTAIRDTKLKIQNYGQREAQSKEKRNGFTHKGGLVKFILQEIGQYTQEDALHALSRKIILLLNNSSDITDYISKLDAVELGDDQEKKIICALKTRLTQDSKIIEEFGNFQEKNEQTNFIAAQARFTQLILGANTIQIKNNKDREFINQALETAYRRIPGNPISPKKQSNILTGSEHGVFKKLQKTKDYSLVANYLDTILQRAMCNNEELTNSNTQTKFNENNINAKSFCQYAINGSTDDVLENRLRYLLNFNAFGARTNVSVFEFALTVAETKFPCAKNKPMSKAANKAWEKLKKINKWNSDHFQATTP